MIKITLKGAGLGEKPKILVDNNVVDKVSIHKPTTLNLERGKHTLQLKNVNGKSIPIEIEVSDETKEYIYNVDLSKTFAEGYFKLVSPINNTNTNFTMTNNEDYMYCSKCGTKISKESTFCNKCGNKIEQSHNTVGEATKTQNNTVTSQSKVTTTTKKKSKSALIIILLIIIGLVVGIGLASISDNGDTNTKTQKETLDQYVGTWTQYNTMDKNRKGTLTLDGKGNYSCRIVVETSFHPTDQTLSGTYKIDNNKITLYYSSGAVWEEYEIISSKVLRSTEYGIQLEYRK